MTTKYSLLSTFELTVTLRTIIYYRDILTISSLFPGVTGYLYIICTLDCYYLYMIRNSMCYLDYIDFIDSTLVTSVIDSEYFLIPTKYSLIITVLTLSYHIFIVIVT